jgi:predicted nucleic acid-binding protein
MSIESGLLDTSTVIMLGHVEDPTSLPDNCLISAITVAELSVGPLVAATDAERAARQAHLQLAEADFDALPFDSACARAIGGVAANLRAAGRRPATRAFDALIAATAIAHGLPVVTCNPADFAHIDHLSVIPVDLAPRIHNPG